MKEVTYEEWQKNPIPRMMWCWNSNAKCKIQAKVALVVKPTRECRYPVLAVTKDDVGYDTFQHCAEIGKQRRMTNKELSRWLRENPTREYRWKNDDCGYSDFGYSDYVYNNHDYLERCADKEVDSSIVIRENDSEWREPTIEV